MKTVKITTDNKISIIDVDFDDFKAIQKAIDGNFEFVKTQKMYEWFKHPVVMIVDEVGHIKQKDTNDVGTFFYNDEQKRGFSEFWPIAGDLIFAIPVGEDLTGWDDEKVEDLKEGLMRYFTYLEEVKE